MALKAGAQIWFPCEVKPGPFSDERFVRVQENGHEWLGFVPVSHLKQPIPEGKTEIRAFVESVSGEKFTARFPGEPLLQSLFEGAVSRVRPLDSLETAHP
jgi:hypothetical protein